MWLGIVKLLLISTRVQCETLVQIHPLDPDDERQFSLFYADVYGGFASAKMLLMEELLRIYPCLLLMENAQDALILYGTCTFQQMLRLELTTRPSDGQWMATARLSNQNCLPKSVEGFVLNWQGLNRTVNEESFDDTYPGMIIELLPYKDGMNYTGVRSKYPFINEWKVPTGHCRCLDGTVQDYSKKWQQLCPVA